MNDDAFEAAFLKTWAVYSKDMKILMDYGDGNYQDTDEDDCLRTLLTMGIKAYLGARRSTLQSVEWLGDGNTIFRFTSGEQRIVPHDDVGDELKKIRAEEIHDPA